MSTLQTLKSFINQRLAVAVEEIFGLLETTISNYEEDINRQRKLLEDERSEFRINKAGLPKFLNIVQTLLVSVKPHPSPLLFDKVLLLNYSTEQPENRFCSV